MTYTGITFEAFLAYWGLALFYSTSAILILRGLLSLIEHLTKYKK